MEPPKAKKIEKQLVAHGQVRIDPYYWLNERENPEVISYLEAENAYTKEVMKHTEGLQEALYNEMIGRIKQTDMSVPYKLNGYYYYTRFEEGKEYPVFCRKKESLDAPEEIMLNVNDMAEGYSYFQVGAAVVSEDNKLLAFSVDTVSRRIYTIHFKSLETNTLLPDKIENTTGGVTWANDHKTVFYSTKDETLRSDKIWRHMLGQPQKEDVLVHHESDVTFSTSIYKTKSRKYLIIYSHSTLTSEYRFLDAGNPGGEFAYIQPRQRELEYSVEHFEDRFIIRTNYLAKNFRLMEAPENQPSLEFWKEIIPHRDTVLLEGFEVFQNYLVTHERINGLTQLRVFDWATMDDRYIPFEEQAYTAYFNINPEFNTDLLRFSYTSLTTPSSIFDINMQSFERQLLKQQEVVGGYDASAYFTERLWAVADDGTKIPISMVYKKGVEINGNAPLLLYGYGSYGASMDPGFNSARLSLLDRGFIYAIAHVRGGEELGRQWYEDGKLLNKKNTFTDFIDCGEFLVAQGYTNPQKLFAMGGSAGGLLIGAVVNMSPQLFKAVIAAVPFVDVVTTMLDESIPLTTGEYDEWGNPNDETYYNYMLSYSPYDNVEKKEYPAMLVTTGLHDSQVQYWEPAKWVAKLRDYKTDDNTLLLWTNMDYGHSGASGRFARYKEIALEYAFLLDQADLTE